MQEVAGALDNLHPRSGREVTPGVLHEGQIDAAVTVPVQVQSRLRPGASQRLLFSRIRAIRGKVAEPWLIGPVIADRRREVALAAKALLDVPEIYATGCSSRATGPSEIGRPETIEETGDLIRAAGGAGAARVVDHEDPSQVAALVAAIDDERGHLDVLVNDIFGGDRYMQWESTTGAGVGCGCCAWACIPI